MRFYLDDDIASGLLAQLLRNAGHDVQIPADAGLSGKSDSEHLAFAIREQRVCMTRNYRDFENLHLLVMQAQGHHAGIMVVRRSNDKKSNLAPRDIVRAIRKFEAANAPIADEYVVLNAWQ
jgi:predicted nuclease of predicted toxin-antitoxin system